MITLKTNEMNQETKLKLYNLVRNIGMALTNYYGRDTDADRMRSWQIEIDDIIKATTIKSQYKPISEPPNRYDTYLVKTRLDTYGFGHFNIDGWTILGDNKGTMPYLWCEIPTTDEKYY